MMLEYVNAFAAGGIASWAVWSIFSGKVRDGVIGKFLYAVIALSGYAILARSDRMFFTPNTAGVTMHVALFLAGLRHMFMLTYWPRVKRWICRCLDCDICKRPN
ncbi:hypothetical protein Q6A49_12510 [Pseudomonas sp. 22-AL-CL-001]|uniref:hypothetical protein n=1 Tax=Pseudomonas alabamensis TaxID=3064349 RepID=UPI002713AEEF|nr:hypothetical protein [Pseudomonas sp. 22-AL-CL-001]MDO7911355.1 hypothetical protein [Pseudomonas sp. 22-AL-CL-001]